MKIVVTTVFILLSVMVDLLSQDFEIVGDSITMSITGTSTLHEWEVDAKQIMDYPGVIHLDDDKLVIDSFTFNVEVASMDGGRGPAMNNKIKKALLSDSHPKVNYHQKESISVTLIEGEKVSFISTGGLAIAGHTEDVDVNCTVLLSDGTVKFTGSQDMLMTDFNISPPTAMFGQIKTNDEITVHFNFIYQKSK